MSNTPNILKENLMRLIHSKYSLPVKSIICLFIMFCLSPLSGCSSGLKDAPETVEVIGTVTIDGTPANGAKVEFLSKEKGLMSTGRTKEDGTFRLIYKKGIWGAPIDDHEVSIETGTIGEDEQQGTKIPTKYGDRKKSGLTATVTEKGPNDFKFELTK